MLTRLRAWYRHDNQELLRREVAWTLRWLCGPWGIGFLCFFTLLEAPLLCGMLTPYMLLDSKMLQVGIGYGGIYFYIPSLFPFDPDICLDGLMLGAVWAFLLAARTSRLIGRGCRGEVLVTPMTARDLFPAMLVAPVTIIILTAGIIYIAGAVGQRNETIGKNLAALGGQYYVQYTWLLSCLKDLGIKLAVTCLAALCAIARPSWLAIVFHGCWTWLGLFAAKAPLSRVIRYAITSIPIAAQHKVAAWWIWLFLDTLLALLCCYLICRFALRRLRSPRTMERLRRAAERC